jgi:tetratricopeptide (TPR) repeat protein
MKRLFLTALLLLALSSLALSQQETARPSQETGDNARQAKEELSEAGRLYKQGDFVGAQRRSELALLLDPSSRIAHVFVARTIHAQYRRGIMTPENIAIARDAINAYQRMLERWPDNEEAFNAIVFLYGAIGEDEKQLELIKGRALDSSVSLEKRSEAYVFLASKDWDCSFRITEANKSLVQVRGRTIIRFKMPENRDDFDRASLCTTRGLEEAGTAIALNDNYDKAWGYKANLLLEAGKLAEMEGKKRRAAQLGREADEAQKQTRELMLKKLEADRLQNPTTVP